MNINNLRKREDGAYEFDIMFFEPAPVKHFDPISFNEALDLLKGRLPIYGEFITTCQERSNISKIDHACVSHQIIEIVNDGKKVTVVFEPIASSKGETLRLILTDDLQAPGFSFFFRGVFHTEDGVIIFDKLVTIDFVKVPGSDYF